MTYTPIPPRRPSRYLGISCLVAGAVFLFDPFIGLFDLLPDCIGYPLVALSLYRLADMNDRLADASRAAFRLALLGVARLVAMMLTFNTGVVSPEEQPVFMLLMLFSLGVLDLIVLIPMWKNFEGGLTYLAVRANATALLDRRLRRGRSRSRSVTERYASFSLFYFILREAMAILPELTVLTHEKGGVEWAGSHLYDYVGLFRGVGCILSLIIGVIWLVRTVALVRRFKQDKPCVESLQRKYETEVLVRHELFATRAVKASLVSLSFAAFLTLDFYIEGVNILPDLFVAVFLLLSLRFVRRYIGANRPAILVTVLYGLAAAVTWILQFTYFNLNDTVNIQESDRLFGRWQVMSVAQVITAVLFVASIALILRSLYGLAQRYTGLRALHEGSMQMADRNASIHKRIRQKLAVVGALAVVAAVSTLVHWCVVPHLAPLEYSGAGKPTAVEALLFMLYDAIREAYWFIDLAIDGAFGAVAIHASSEIFEQMDYSNLMNEGSR